MTAPFILTLASASPRRRALLEQIGLVCRILPVDLDESVHANELPEAYVRRLALDKARAARAQCGQNEALPVLGADTTVVLDGTILGKPADCIEAQVMLASLAGRTHEVLTAVAVVFDGLEGVTLSRSQVTFRAMSQAECAAYAASGEPLDKAGAYAIQGLGAKFVSWLEGSYSGVMGLPLYETSQLLAEVGVELPTSLTDKDDVV